MTPLELSPWDRFFEEFHCRECAADTAYRSRSRGFFEKYILPMLFLQPVRCDRCFHRSYVLRTIPTKTRSVPFRKEPQGTADGSSSKSRVA